MGGIGQGPTRGISRDRASVRRSAINLCSVTMAATNKCLAQNNKSRTETRATKKRRSPTGRHSRWRHRLRPATAILAGKAHDRAQSRQWPSGVRSTKIGAWDEAMKALLLASSMLAMITAANAADITTKHQSDGSWNVLVTGEIKSGDDEKFHRVTDRLPSSVTVELSSLGGDVAAGLRIGEEIRIRQFGTFINNTCASVCGLIWLAGYPRMIMDDAHVGFHAAYYSKNGQVSPGANAVIGAYLNRLGFSYNAVEFLTYTTPGSMQWLTSDLAAKYGIDAWVLPRSQEPESVQRPNVWMTVIGTIAIAIFLLGAWKRREIDLGAMLFPAGKLTTFDKMLLGVTAVPVTILVGGILGAWMFH